VTKSSARMLKLWSALGTLGTVKYPLNQTPTIIFAIKRVPGEASVWESTVHQQGFEVKGKDAPTLIGAVLALTQAWVEATSKE